MCEDQKSAPKKKGTEDALIVAGFESKAEKLEEKEDMGYMLVELQPRDEMTRKASDTSICHPWG